MKRLDKPSSGDELEISTRGLALLESFEGLNLNAYRDIAGVLTIGYGHTGKDVYEGQNISLEEADSLLRLDTHLAAAGINRLVKVPLSQNQFDALVCFAYNVGVGALASSTLLKVLNQGKYEEARKQILRWNKAGGHESSGLTIRRQTEALLFGH